jgi:hypothetical protein
MTIVDGIICRLCDGLEEVEVEARAAEEVVGSESGKENEVEAGLLAVAEVEAVVELAIGVVIKIVIGLKRAVGVVEKTENAALSEEEEVVVDLNGAVGKGKRIEEVAEKRKKIVEVNRAVLKRIKIRIKRKIRELLLCLPNLRKNGKRLKALLLVLLVVAVRESIKKLKLPSLLILLLLKLLFLHSLTIATNLNSTTTQVNLKTNPLLLLQNLKKKQKLPLLTMARTIKTESLLFGLVAVTRIKNILVIVIAVEMINEMIGRKMIKAAVEEIALATERETGTGLLLGGTKTRKRKERAVAR